MSNGELIQRLKVVAEEWKLNAIDERSRLAGIPDVGFIRGYSRATVERLEQHSAKLQELIAEAEKPENPKTVLKAENEA